MPGVLGICRSRTSPGPSPTTGQKQSVFLPLRVTASTYARLTASPPSSPSVSGLRGQGRFRAKEKGSIRPSFPLPGPHPPHWPSQGLGPGGSPCLAWGSGNPRPRFPGSSAPLGDCPPGPSKQGISLRLLVSLCRRKDWGLLPLPLLIPVVPLLLLLQEA